MVRVKGWFGSLVARLKAFKWTKKKVFALVLLIGAAIGAMVFFKTRGNTAKAVANTYTRTVTLQAGTLTDSVSVTGLVESVSVTNITSTASAKVASVSVQEGDTVTKGQTLATLDSEDIEEQIADAKSSLSDNIAKAQKTYDSAISTRDTAYNSAIDAENALNSASATLNNATAAYNTAKSSVAAAQSLYDTAYAADQTQGFAVNSAFTAMVNAGKTENDGSAEALAYTQAKADKATTEAALQKAQQELETAKTNCNYATYEQAYTQASNTYTQARTNLTNMEKTYQQALDAVDTAADQLKSAKDGDQLKTLQEQLADCTITATTDGTITAVNVTVGNVAGGTGGNTLFTIQDTANLKVSISIDENDIKNISVGMRAVVTSDATGEEEFGAYVSQISQTASQGTFTAEVTLNDANTGLLIGLNANVNIILNSLDNVYSVPVDAVGTDESGNSVVYVKQTDGTFSPVTVTTGETLNYYVEISGSNLQAGMEIRYSADETSIDATQGTGADSTAADGGFSFNMGGTADMGGGNRPSGTDMGGGGTPPSGGGAPGGV